MDAGAERHLRGHGAFGYHDPADAFSRRSYALGVDIPAVHTTVSFRAGLIDYACDAKQFVREALLPIPGFDCDHALMGGARWGRYLDAVRGSARRLRPPDE